jgi:imidazolonepropionase-like amidohydrolase
LRMERIWEESNGPSRWRWNFHIWFNLGLRRCRRFSAATSRAAELLDEKGELGVVAVGAYADIVAVSGDPLNDVKELANVRFVMKGGSVFKNDWSRK